MKCLLEQYDRESYTVKLRKLEILLDCCGVRERRQSGPKQLNCLCLATEISVWFGNLLVSPDIEDQQGTQNLACVQTITIIILHFSISVSLPMEK